MIDQTLADYIKRVAEQIKEEPLDKLPNPNYYPVYPEDDGYDTPKNTFSNH